MIKNTLRIYVIKTDHVIAKKIEVNWFKYFYDLIFERLIQSFVCFECAVSCSHICLSALIYATFPISIPVGYRAGNYGSIQGCFGDTTVYAAKGKMTPR